MKAIAFIAVCSAGTALLAGSSAQAQNKSIKEGTWRGVFTVNEKQVPFNFELRTGGPSKSLENASLALVNGSRRDYFVVKQIAPDSIFVKMNTYDAALVAKIEDDGRLTGAYKSLVPNFRGKSYRFVEPGKDIAPTASLTGKWKINIISKDPFSHRVALLEQKGNCLTGVVMSVVGDTRELEGTVQGNEFTLSGFTGPSPILIRGTVNEDKSISGEIGLGIYVNQKFEGILDKKAELPDPYALTHLKEGVTKFDFNLPDLTGKQVSLSDAKYRGKVVIIDIVGTWCPNCIDETAFLAPWYQANKQRGVEIIGLAFERKNDLAFAKTALSRLINRYDVQYDILFSGIADKKVASEALPALNKVLAFPTTIILDRQGNVAQIHTGYTGPATGKYYDEYVAEFNQTIDKLVKNEPVATATGGGGK